MIKQMLRRTALSLYWFNIHINIIFFCYCCDMGVWWWCSPISLLFEQCLKINKRCGTIYVIGLSLQVMLFVMLFIYDDDGDGEKIMEVRSWAVCCAYALEGTYVFFFFRHRYWTFVLCGWSWINSLHARHIYRVVLLGIAEIQLQLGNKWLHCQKCFKRT